MTPNASLASVNREHRDVPVKDLVVDPSANYRWGSEDARREDLSRLDVIEDDGHQVSSYAALKSSIVDIGVQEPIGVVEREGSFHVFYGFTRATAASEVGLDTVPAYVYDDELDEAEVALLQLRENNPTLKRRVNWVQEIEHYRGLVDQLAPRFRKMPKSRRPRDDDGNAMSPKDAARYVVCRSLGVSPNTMRNRAWILGKLDDRVVDLARRGVLDHRAAAEFYSGDNDAPFDRTFVGHVLDELMPDGDAPDVVTVGAVRAAMKTTRENVDVPVHEPGTVPQTAGASWGDTRLSPGACRDLSVDMAAVALRSSGVDHASVNERRLQGFVDGPVWNQIVGIGVAAGDVIHGPAEMILGEDPDDDAIMRRETHHETAADAYAGAAFVTAIVRDRIGARHWRDWLNESTDGRMNRITFHAALQDACRDLRNRSLKDKLDAVIEALLAKELL